MPFAQWHAIQAQLALAGLQEARQQVDEGCLARTRGPDQGDRFAGLEPQVHIAQRWRGVAAVIESDGLQFDLAAHARSRYESAALLFRAVLDQVDAAFERGQAPRQRPHAVRQVFERRHQHQHGSDEGHESAHGGAAAVAGAGALGQGHHDHSRQRDRGNHLRDRRAGGGRRGRLDHQAAQQLAVLAEALALRQSRAMQAHDAPGQHVLFDHVGQLVGGGLVRASEPVKPPRHDAHHQGDRRCEQRHQQRQLPVQPQQVAEQGDEGHGIAHDHQQRLHQPDGTGLRFVDHRIGQAARAVSREQGGRSIQQAREHHLAQGQHTEVGGPGQRVGGQKRRQAA